MSRSERIRDDHDRYIKGLRVIVFLRSRGLCETCGDELNWNNFQLAHIIARGKIEREALRRGLSTEQAWRASWQACVIKATCPCAKCNDGALLSRGIQEDALIDKAIKEASSGRPIEVRESDE